MITKATLTETEAAAKLRGWSVVKLCKELKIGRASWYRWQTGKFNPPLMTCKRLEAMHTKLTNGG